MCFDYFVFHLRHPECADIIHDYTSRKKRRIDNSAKTDSPIHQSRESKSEEVDE